MNEHIAIIPIREHSKGIRNKNIYLFENHKTSLEMVAEVVQSVGLIDIYVSTESTMLSAYAKLLGLNVLFRDPEFSKDSITLDQVISYHLHQDCCDRYKFVWVIQATCPLIKKSTITSIYELITSDKSISTIFTATVENIFLWRRDTDGTYIKSYNTRLNRQWSKSEYIRETGNITVSRLPLKYPDRDRFSQQKVVPYLIDSDEAIDIDTYSDLVKVNNVLRREDGIVIFITDASAQIGTGHLYRVITLAAGCNPFHFKIFIKDTQIAKSILATYEYDYSLYENINDVYSQVEHLKIKSIVLDRLETNDQEFGTLKQLDAPIFSFEDHGIPALAHSRAIINSLYETTQQIQNVYSGYQYEVIRPDILKYAKFLNRSLNGKSTDIKCVTQSSSEKNNPIKIFICFGGSDPNNFFRNIQNYYGYYQGLMLLMI